MIGISWEGGPNKQGDLIALVSHVPENYYKNTGEKLIDVSNLWPLDFNPYIIRNQQPTEIWRLWGHDSDFCGATQAHTICHKFGLKCYLNRGRLYKHEELKQSSLLSRYNSVVFHFRGESVGMVPIAIQNEIVARYKAKGWWTIQLGNKTDYYCGADLDRRGIDIWESCKYVAEAQEAVVVDSVIMHVAHTYNTRCKTILVNKTESEIESFHPLMWNEGRNCGWVGMGEVYNCFENDLGLVQSYLFI